MSVRRTLAVAVVVLCGAAVASAQTPGGNRIGVRGVTTVSPVPAMQMQQELAWQNAVRQAQLWQMYNPPVVIVNHNPWANFNTWAPSYYNTPGGSLWNSNTNFYRGNNLNWTPPGLNRPFR